MGRIAWEGSCMSIWPAAKPTLFGTEGELVLLRVCAEPRTLEELLETLGQLAFPVNPELRHETNSVIVEFPAYSGSVPEVRRLLQLGGFDPASLEVERPLAQHAS